MKLTKILMIIAIVLVVALAAMMIAASIGGKQTADATTGNTETETFGIQVSEGTENVSEPTEILPDPDSNLSFSTLSPDATRAPEATQEASSEVTEATEAPDSETEAEEEDPLSPSIEDMTDLA